MLALASRRFCYGVTVRRTLCKTPRCEGPSIEEPESGSRTRHEKIFINGSPIKILHFSTLLSTIARCLTLLSRVCSANCSRNLEFESSFELSIGF